MPWGRLSLWKWVPGISPWVKAYHPCSAETSRKSGALNYPEPLGPPRPVAGHLYFIYIYIYIFCSYCSKDIKILGTELGLICVFLFCIDAVNRLHWCSEGNSQLRAAKNFHVHKAPPLVPVLDLINSFHSTTSCFLKITLLLAFHQTWVLSLPWRCFHRNLVTHTYMFCPSHPAWTEHISNAYKVYRSRSSSSGSSPNILLCQNYSILRAF